MSVDKYRYKDNSRVSKANDEQVERFLTTELASEFLGRTLDDIAASDSVFVFPPRLDDSSDLDKDQLVLASCHDGIQTGNVMGFIGKGNDELTICSRFSTEEHDYFLNHMLRRVFVPNVVDYRVSFETEEGYFELLPLLFPTYLVRAFRKGILRTYVRRAHDDSHLRGAIDVKRHISHNTPFRGNVAYSTREYDDDNVITELVRHTIEYLEANPSGIGSLLSQEREMRDAVSAIRLATPRYSRGDRRRVIAVNQKHPVRHHYYSEYLDLQKLCLAILTHRKISFRGDAEKAHGILFDGAWLWEEYVYTLLRDYAGDAFFHPRNKSREGKQHLFRDQDRVQGLIYPDFISRCQSPRVIADAKYKPRGNIYGSDYLQILAYMFRFDSQAGLFLYPRDKADDIDSVLYVMRGAKIPGEAMGDTEEPRDEKHAPKVKKIGLTIPQERFSSYSEYSEQMGKIEKSFADEVNKYMESEEG